MNVTHRRGGYDPPAKPPSDEGGGKTEGFDGGRDRRARALPLQGDLNTAHPPVFGIGGSAPYDPRGPMRHRALHDT